VLVFVNVVAIAQIRARHICKRPHGGSLKGRMPNRDIGRAAGAIQIDRDTFAGCLHTQVSPLHSTMSLRGDIGFLVRCMSAFVTGCSKWTMRILRSDPIAAVECLHPRTRR
jgi:hypothetical protein